MLSIIVPVYNAAAHLRQCVESVLAQSSADWELILVDDGSSDASPALCDEFAELDSRIRVIHQANAGVSMARNAGLEVALGDFVSFIDSDDYVVPVYCETILREMQGYDLLYFANDCIFADGHTEQHVPALLSAHSRLESEKGIFALKQDKSFEFFGYTWNKCFRRSIVSANNITFLQGLSFREDDLFTSSFFQHVNAIHIIDDVLYVYRVSSSGLTFSAFKPDAILNFVRSLAPLAERIDFVPLQDFEFARMAGLLLMLAKLHRPSAPTAFAMVSSFVSAHPHAPFSRKVEFIFRGILPQPLMFRVCCWMWDVKKRLGALY